MAIETRSLPIASLPLSTTLGAFCAKLIEAGWLAAAVITPLYFDPYSSRVFEADKVALLRSIALVMLAAWLARCVEQASHRCLTFHLPWRSPLAFPALAVVAVSLLATLTSVSPYASLWGSYQRSHGAFTTLSCVLVFFFITNEMRSRAQLDRLITTAIFASVPVALYAMVQRFGLEPLPWGGGVIYRVIATMGNPTFLAAYMIMIFFPTVGRAVESLSAGAAGQAGWGIRSARTITYLFVALLQFAAIWLTKSRGPWIGWLAGIFIFVLLGLLRLRRLGLMQRTCTWLMAAWLALGVMAIAFFIILHLSNTPPAAVGNLPQWRILKIFDLETGEGRVHALVWKGAAQLVWWHDPLQFPGGKPDPLNAIRPFIGYGPESMYVAFSRFYLPELAHYEARNALPDRAYNVTFDVLVTTGALGLLVYLILVSSVFYYGLCWLGWITGKRQRIVWLLLWLGCGALGAMAPAIWGEPGLSGMGLPLGMVIGLALYLVGYALLRDKAQTSDSLDHNRWILLAALVSALLAHLVEIASGIAIAATMTCFWIYAALLVVLGRGWAAQPPTALLPKTDTIRRLPPWLFSLLTFAVLLALILGALAFEFVTNAERQANPLSVIWRSLAPMPYQALRANYGVIAMVLLAWLIVGLLSLVELRWNKSLGSAKSWIGGGAILHGASFCLAALFTLVLAGQLGSLTRVTVKTIDDAAQIADRIAGLFTCYYGYVFLTILIAAGLLLAQDHSRGVPLASKMGMVSFPLILLAAACTLVYANLNPIYADIVYKQGDLYDRSGQWDVAIAHYKRAIELAPHEDFYYLFLGRSLLEKAGATPSASNHLLDEPVTIDKVLSLNSAQIAQLGRSELLAATQAALACARQLNPLNTDHSANLARLHRRWAELAESPQDKKAHIEQSIAYYRDATNQSPNSPTLWNEWATIYLSNGDIEAALQKLERSIELDDQFDQTYLVLGDLYMRQQYLAQAAQAFGKALEINPSHFQARSQLCHVYTQQGNLDLALDCYKVIVQQRPSDWSAYKNIAVLYDRKGDLDKAVRQAQMARQLAPQDQHPSLDEYIAQLQARLGQSPSLPPNVSR